MDLQLLTKQMFQRRRVQGIMRLLLQTRQHRINSFQSPSNQFYITSTTSHVTNKTQTHRVTDRNGALLTEVSESKTLHEQRSVKQAVRLSEPVNIPVLTSALQRKQQQQITHSVRKSTPTTAKPRIIIVKTTTQKPIIRITPSRNQQQVVRTQPVQQKQNCPSVCYSDKDCGKGRCLGSNLGKCSCSHCVSMLACKSDADCGGLRGACENSICKCAQVGRK
ncbi:hypothetical protein WR25_07666 [Diploscapter pachys]|uniref:Uncharacterized protein n=1 Tax=Diploscapter pachys TaxID=2018661 RepID=A0A2A2LUY3_9BILA|nr:hypothetical protein WR25_07666 [Diploscapter pachys]